ncbi:hypothetical protein H9P43_000372 [Blastocladiella emersonii ATCC 22665]|nr:hypothetical protein H9P43_000372 [Blastocladiella emersonii ATCC 22665]
MDPYTASSLSSLGPEDAITVGPTVVAPRPPTVPAVRTLSEAEVAAAVSTHAAEVTARIEHAVTSDHALVAKPDASKPFTSLVDAFERLVPFHVLQYPEDDLRRLLAGATPRTRDTPPSAAETDVLRRAGELEARLDASLRKDLVDPARDPVSLQALQLLQEEQRNAKNAAQARLSQARNKYREASNRLTSATTVAAPPPQRPGPMDRGRTGMKRKVQKDPVPLTAGPAQPQHQPLPGAAPYHPGYPQPGMTTSYISSAAAVPPTVPHATAPGGAVPQYMGYPPPYYGAPGPAPAPMYSYAMQSYYASMAAAAAAGSPQAAPIPSPAGAAAPVAASSAPASGISSPAVTVPPTPQVVNPAATQPPPSTAATPAPSSAMAAPQPGYPAGAPAPVAPPPGYPAGGPAVGAQPGYPAGPPPGYPPAPGMYGMPMPMPMMGAYFNPYLYNAFAQRTAPAPGPMQQPGVAPGPPPHAAAPVPAQPGVPVPGYAPPPPQAPAVTTASAAPAPPPAPTAEPAAKRQKTDGDA